MNGKQTGEVVPQGDKVDTPVEAPDKSLNIVDEARAIRDEIRQAKEELKAENDRKEKIQSEELLAGTTGGKVEVEKKEETPKDYAAKILTGAANDKPTED